jgi:selenium donor protein
MATPLSIPAPVRLTSLSHGAGCACKLGSAELAEVLRHLPAVDDARVLVDAATRDDAAVYRIAPDRALVATLDFFTPILDNPVSWGAVAAANAMSDVYAMGGQPLFALNIVAWPRDTVPFEVLGEVLRGASEVARRAGCLMLGGHSIDDAEPKFGMAVIGEVHPDRMFTNAGGCAGDMLVLTKPLGTGILSTALKRDALLETGMTEAVHSMTTLNGGAARAAREAGISAATDVTGFGLIGHLTHIVNASGLAAELWFDELPILPHVRNLVGRGFVPGGTRRNLEAATNVTWDDSLTDADRAICADAQTSGGLLLAVPVENHGALLEALRREGTPVAVTIGRLVAGSTGAIRVQRHRGN